jgi:hypothetical protein
MPWRCPACQVAIEHNPHEDRPRTGVTYRCHVCRLELVLDPVTDRMVVAPRPDDSPPERPRRRIIEL